MAGMLRKLGMTLEGRHHSGIDDCRNISRVALKMMADGCVFGVAGDEDTSASAAAGAGGRGGGGAVGGSGGKKSKKKMMKSGE